MHGNTLGAIFPVLPAAQRAGAADHAGGAAAADRRRRVCGPQLCCLRPGCAAAPSAAPQGKFGEHVLSKHEVARWRQASVTLPAVLWCVAHRKHCILAPCVCNPFCRCPTGAAWAGSSAAASPTSAAVVISLVAVQALARCQVCLLLARAPSNVCFAWLRLPGTA